MTKARREYKAPNQGNLYRSPLLLFYRIDGSVILQTCYHLTALPISTAHNKGVAKNREYGLHPYWI
jgi:hypothetical protein